MNADEIRESFLSNQKFLEEMAEKEYRRYAKMAFRKKIRAAFLIATAGIASYLAFYHYFINPIDESSPLLATIKRTILTPQYILIPLGLTIIAIIVRQFFNYLQPETLTSSSSSRIDESSLRDLLRRHEAKIYRLDAKYDTIIQKLQSGGSAGEIFS
ncbi:hypothetical protein [Metapseudomonas resinovorans]|uniref:hypothetical protein n=1 Tax=Metapseudomonas resinovorans TaxID=53412 RepID=UPI0012DF149D|nr:hypothetical protein [Pseudomonas resinovorans]